MKHVPPEAISDLRRRLVLLAPRSAERRLLEDYGVQTPDGPVRAPKDVLTKTTVNRCLQRWGYDRETLGRPPPAVRFQARYSNECWQFDLNPSDLKRVERPEWFEEGRGHPLLMLYSVVDDRSGFAYQEYHGVYGEDVEAALRFLFAAMAPKNDESLPFQGIPAMLYLDNGPIAKSRVFRRVMDYLGIDVRTHMPRSKNSRKATARAKGKVERPFRTVREMHETLFHFHKPETESEANTWLLRFLVRYNGMQHRAEPHSRLEDWLRNLPEEGLRTMCDWERFCTFAREPERRLVGVDARIVIGSTDDRIEKFIADTAARAKEQISDEKEKQLPDFGRYIKEWATQYGFSVEEAQAEIERWVSEVQQKQDDFYKLGLAAFAEKNFARANELFLDSATVNAERMRETERHIEAQKQRFEGYREATIRDYRLAGDAAYNDYAFAKALDAYRAALDFTDQGQRPRQWAEVTMDVAKANYAIGIRTEGSAVQQRLAEAVAAYRAALEVRTRELLPQQWAATQNNLGNVLGNQGTRTGGEEGRRLLAEALDAFRGALGVYHAAGAGHYVQIIARNITLTERLLNTESKPEECCN